MKTYRYYMDHLGNKIDEMDVRDELICAFCIVVTSILLSAILTGAI